MKKIIKRFLKILASLILILLILLITIPFIFKDKIIKLAKDEINSSLNAKVDFGEFDLSVFSSFPDLKFDINNVSVIGIDTFANDTLAYIKTFETNIDIMSIFGDNIKIKTIRLINPKISAKVLADSTANWDIYISENDTTTEDTTSESSTSYKLALKEFTIKNATIKYDDRVENMNTTIKNLNFSLSGDLAEDFSKLKTKTSIEQITFSYDGIQYLKKALIKFDADIDADLKNSKYTFKENTFKINELELGFDGYISMPNDTDIDMDITYKLKQTNFKNLLSLIPAIYMNDFSDIKTSGKLSLNGFAKGIYNDYRLPSFDLTLLVKNAMFKYPDLPKDAKNININLKISNPDGIDDHTKINLKKFHIEMAQNPFDMQMLITTPISDANISGNFKGKIDLDKLKEIVPLDSMTINGLMTINLNIKGKMSDLDNEKYENFDLNGELTLNNFKYTDKDFPQGIQINKTDMNFSPQFVNLKTFDAKTGKSDIHADGKIDNMLQYYFNNQTLKGTFNISSNLINLNEFMTDDQTTSNETNETNETSDEELSVIEIPKNINFNLNASFKKLIYDNININNTKGEIIIKDGIASLSNLSMNMLDGSMKMSGDYNTKDITKPFVDFNFNIINFDIKKSFETFNTIQKLAPIAESCKGKFSVDLAYNSKLDNKMEPILNTTNGNGKLHTKTIKIENSPTFNKLNEALKTNKFKTINLKDLNIAFKIENGNISVEPFDIKIDKLTANISGSQNLDQSLNYKMDINMPRSELGGQANKVIDNLISQANSKGANIKTGNKINIKAFIGGTVTNPKISLNLKDQATNVINDLKEQAKEKINEQIDKAKEQAIKKAEEERAKLMAEANAKAKQIIAAAEKTSKQIKATGKKTADKIRNEARKKAADLKNKANNPISKRAAEETGKKLIKEADAKANKIETEANKKGDQTVKTAKQKAKKIQTEAQQKGDLLVKKAKES